MGIDCGSLGKSNTLDGLGGGKQGGSGKPGQRPRKARGRL